MAPSAVGPRQLGAALLALGLGAAAVQAQFHPLPEPPPPLHARLSASDVVAVGRIVAVEPGRLLVSDATGLSGEVPSEFRIKRSPLRPPPHQVGDLAVLFLRGARPPYVLADGQGEMLRSADPEAAARLAQAVRALISADSDRDQLLALHLGWLGGADADLRDQAVLAFRDPKAPFAPVGPGFARALAREVFDPARSPAARRGFAAAAISQPAGVDALLRRVPGETPLADAEITRLVLRVSILMGHAGSTEALVRALGHEDPAIREAGLKETRQAQAATSAELRDALATLAASDPDPGIRRDAASRLESLASGGASRNP